MQADLLNVTVLWSIYLLFSLGLSLVWGSIGILNLAHGSIFMFSAYVGHTIADRIAMPVGLTIASCAVVGSLMSLVIQLVVFEPIRGRGGDAHATQLQVLIGGVAVAVVPVALVEKLTTNEPFGFVRSSEWVQVYSVHGLNVTNVQLLIVACALLIAPAAAVWLRISRTGLALRAMAVDRETTSLMGVNQRQLAAATMALAGGAAGLAGALLTYHLGSMTAVAGDSLMLKAFAAIVLGGVGSAAGVIIGCLVLAGSETFVLTHTSGSWVDAISFGLIFLVLLLRPQGLLGRAEVRRT